MKKIILIFLIVFGLFAVNVTQASAGCNIVWTGYQTGSIPTNETLRTDQATHEAYQAICPSCGGIACGVLNYIYFCNGDSYGCLDFKAYRPFYICKDGSYHFYYGSGNWDVICETTLIKLSSFAATPKSEKVILQWNTESEIDNAGFNIYRATAEDGEYIKINSALIAAEGSSTQGTNYEFIDYGLKNGKTYYYKLEDIDLNGSGTLHGPVSATPRLLYGMKK